MVPELRRAFNEGFTPQHWTDYLRILEADVGVSPFRLAETVLFVPRELRDFLDRNVREILAQLSRPEAIERMLPAIPPAYRVPGRDALPNCAQIDFAVVRGPSGALEGRLIELQGFPSLYSFIPLQFRTMVAVLRTVPGLDRPWSMFLGHHDEASALELVKRAVLAGEDPEAVVLVDLDPPRQKTVPDFHAAKKLLGIDAVCVTELVQQGRALLRRKEGKLVPVRRIYHRVVFDELERKGVHPSFSLLDELDVSWCPHPTWYFAWSKYSLPLLHHPAVPEARLLSDPGELLDDLSHCVLKPLFSFAGAGVLVDPTPADVAAIPGDQRPGWLVQRKVDYTRELRMPDGTGVAAEVRVMCIRPPDAPQLEPVYVLVRLSRGKMIGVDFNRDLPWTGSSVGMWEP